MLLGLFGAYLWRLSQLPRAEDTEETAEVGPAAALTQLPRSQQWAIIAALAVVAAGIILAVAEPFAESLIATGTTLGINKFLLIQWIAPLAGEAPEIVITILFTLNLRPTAALGALVSDKINQWTLLVGMIPLFYSLGAGRIGFLPLDARQHEEFFLTAAQSLFAVGLLLELRLTLPGALALLGLFGIQLGLGFLFRDDETQTIRVLTVMAWLYLVLAAALFIWQRAALVRYLQVGLLNRPVPPVDRPESADPGVDVGAGEPH